MHVSAGLNKQCFQTLMRNSKCSIRNAVAPKKLSSQRAHIKAHGLCVGPTALKDKSVQTFCICSGSEHPVRQCKKIGVFRHRRCRGRTSSIMPPDIVDVSLKLQIPFSEEDFWGRFLDVNVRRRLHFTRRRGVWRANVGCMKGTREARGEESWAAFEGREGTFLGEGGKAYTSVCTRFLR